MSIQALSEIKSILDRARRHLMHAQTDLTVPISYACSNSRCFTTAHLIKKCLEGTASPHVGLRHVGA